MIFRSIIATSAVVLGVGLSTANAAEQKFISIGTGGVTGVYYPTGGAICRLVNKKTQRPWFSLLSRINRRIHLQHQIPSVQVNLNLVWHSQTGSTTPTRGHQNSRTRVHSANCVRCSPYTLNRSPLLLVTAPVLKMSMI